MKVSAPTTVSDPRPPLVGSPWHLLPEFLLRQAGYPLDWLTDLASPAATVAAESLLRERATVRDARRRALESLRATAPGSATVPGDTFGALRRWTDECLGDAQGEIPSLQDNDVDSEVLARVDTLVAGLQQLEEARKSFASLFTDEFERTSRHVFRRFHDDHRLQDALLLSNPANFHVFASWLAAYDLLEQGDGDRGRERRKRNKDRRKIDTLTLYLQRFCAKCETSSHFGPFAAGRIIPERQGVTWEYDAGLSCVAYYAHWVTAELARQISRDHSLAHEARPRRTPFSFLAGNLLCVLDYHFEARPVAYQEGPGRVEMLPAVELSPDDRALWSACNGDRSIRELFTWWRDINPSEEWEQFQSRLATLERHGALILTFEIPTGSAAPLADLRALLPPAAPASARWLHFIERATHDLQEFAATHAVDARQRLYESLRQQAEDATGAPSTRGLGQIYADRSVLYEECQRHLHKLSIGGDLARAISHDLALYYDLILLTPRHRLAAEREMLATWFHERFGTVQHVSMATFLTVFAEDEAILEGRYTLIDASVDAIEHEINRQLLPSSSDQRAEFHLTPEAIRSAIARYHIPIPTICNPDVMVCASSIEATRRGDFQLLVGDFHVEREIISHRSWSPQTEETFPSLGQDVLELCRASLGVDEEFVDVIREHISTSSSTQLVLECPDLEVLGRSPKPRRDVLALRDLQVHLTPVGLRSYAPRLKRFIRLLYPGMFAWAKRNALDIFGFPQVYESLVITGRGREHLPRIVMDRVVLQRELWRIPTTALANPVTIGRRRLDGGKEGEFLRAKAVQREFHLPRYGFAKISTEPKPIFVDFDAPLLARQLIRLGARSSGVVEFTELFPPHDGLWLEDVCGRYVTEFRFALCWPGPLAAT